MYYMNYIAINKLHSQHSIHYIALHNFSFCTLHLLHCIDHIAYCIHCIAHITLHILHCMCYITYIKLHTLHCIQSIIYITSHVLHYMHYIACITLHTYTSKLVVTDRPTDRQTDRRTDIVPYRAAIAAKNIYSNFLYSCMWNGRLGNGRVCSWKENL